MRVFAGIDGGGTRTRLALVREDGVLVGFAEGGCCSFAELGVPGARRALNNLWKAGWRSAHSSPRPVNGVFIGTGSVLSTQDEHTKRGIALSLRMGRPGNVRAGNDALNALAGALNGEPGILLISGTGSACMGRNAAGKTWRAGGWGHLLDDVGSAYAFGTAAMIAATRHADGRGPRTTLTSLVCEKFQLRDLREIYRKVHYGDGVSRAEIATLAPDVVAAAKAGDAVAKRILQEGAAGLVEMVVTVARQLRLRRPRLALRGGLITDAAFFRKMFLAQLHQSLPGVELASDGVEPVFGAVMLAYEHARGVWPPRLFLQTLRATCASRGISA